MDWIIEADATCPYCWESIPLAIDTTQGNYETVEDCPVCCRPIRHVVRCRAGELEELRSEPG